MENYGLSDKTSSGGRELGIKQIDLNIIMYDHFHTVVEQGFQMLLKWYQGCDPAKRTLRILKEALERTDCHDALEITCLEFVGYINVNRTNFSILLAALSIEDQVSINSED
ncbi:repeat, PH and SEC7 domain containing secG-like isoform X17 [Octopus vulgaris]|uniref:Repeat, PH and SEC7 domain containing secG-like isoform X17 n=1 Tax=Octopus vulgaris TaxID=6645 RepID=A0AA36FRF7_OCTVU|nr:repeat, PH and SEC7 domain containing secG-like isoform X17 [Octopus vulgaris]